MNIRLRKFIGTVTLLIFLSIYVLLAMLVAIVLQVNSSKVIEVLYYLIAGFFWTIPAGIIIWWMQRPD
ncbi:MAG: DUF2842 domain-containing protein [Hyphomicrobiaceae bacterium]|nr:DUF2842 domain-containing protein [Hyphomicrobiaceae bacterium]